jgi:hypothetical protein
MKPLFPAKNCAKRETNLMFIEDPHTPRFPADPFCARIPKQQNETAQTV